MTVNELKELFFDVGQCDSYGKTKKPISKLKWIIKQAEKERTQFTIKILDEIFTDGCGNIDDCCSKDDLIKEYLIIINKLKQQL